MLTEAFESDLLGFNVRGGLSSKIGPGLRVGITLESPTFYTVTENYSTRLQVGFDNGNFDTYGDEFEEDAGTGEFEYQIRTPWRLGGGLAFDAGILVLSADVEAVDWSRLRLDSDTDSFDDVNQAIEDSLDIVVNGRLGAQFRLGNLILRAGYAIQPDPRSGILDIERVQIRSTTRTGPGGRGSTTPWASASASLTTSTSTPGGCRSGSTTRVPAVPARPRQPRRLALRGRDRRAGSGLARPPLRVLAGGRQP